MQETAHRTRDVDPVNEAGWPLQAGTRALAVEGDLTAARVWFEQAYEAAEPIGDRRTMAAAALGMGGLWVHEHRSVTVAMTVEQRMRHAVSLPDARSPVALRLRLRVRLAGEAGYRSGDPTQVLAVLDEARLAGDPVALAEALSIAHHCILGPGRRTPARRDPGQPRPRPLARRTGLPAAVRPGAGSVRGGSGGPRDLYSARARVDRQSRPPERAGAARGRDAAPGRAAGEPGHGDRGRDDDIDCESRRPAPDLSQLPALLATVRHAGLPVDFAVHGHRTPLTPSLELSTYRIVQEALTNTLKHAGPARAGVTLRYHQEAGVEVEIVDDGRGPRPDTVPGGRGLVGMQERVNLHGGRLNAGPLQDGGYRVHAVLGLS